MRIYRNKRGFWYLFIGWSLFSHMDKLLPTLVLVHPFDA